MIQPCSLSLYLIFLSCFWLHDYTQPVITWLVIEKYSHVLLLFLKLVSSLACPLFFVLVVLKLLACFFVLSGTVLLASIERRCLFSSRSRLSSSTSGPPETFSRRSRTRSLCVSVHNPCFLQTNPRSLQQLSAQPRRTNAQHLEQDQDLPLLRRGR